MSARLRASAGVLSVGAGARRRRGVGHRGEPVRSQRCHGRGGRRVGVPSLRGGGRAPGPLPRPGARRPAGRDRDRLLRSLAGGDRQLHHIRARARHRAVQRGAARLADARLPIRAAATAVGEGNRHRRGAQPRAALVADHRLLAPDPGGEPVRPVRKPLPGEQPARRTPARDGRNPRSAVPRIRHSRPSRHRCRPRRPPEACEHRDAPRARPRADRFDPAHHGGHRLPRARLGAGLPGAARDLLSRRSGGDHHRSRARARLRRRGARAPRPRPARTPGSGAAAGGDGQGAPGPDPADRLLAPAGRLIRRSGRHPCPAPAG